jgi:hypothetical protein
VTPAVFGDELLYSKLAQSIAAGHGLVLRGEPVSFPAPLAILLEAPAWLFHATPTAYAVAKAMNVAVMSSAVFPAYCLARRLMRPSFAVLAASIAVAGPAMLYAPYLMSEALAYPVFLLALVTMVRALERPTRLLELAVPVVSVAAVLTRIQFVVVPLAYFVAVPLVARGGRLKEAARAHALSLGGLLAFGLVPVVTGGSVLGTYLGAATLHVDPLAVLRWSGLTAALLPFIAGWLIVPGGLLGLWLLVARPRNGSDAAVGALALASIVLVLLEIGLVGAAEAGRSMERYGIYVVPLLAIGFFAYVERGAPWWRLHAALALAAGSTAWLLNFPARAGAVFSFDTPSFSVYGQAAAWLGHENAITLFAAIPFFGSVALAFLPLARRRVAAGVGAATLVLLVLSGATAYAGDHAMTRGTLAMRAGNPPDWLDRSGLGPADYLELPGGSAHYGWLLETWNRSFRRAIRLGIPTEDGYATHTALVDRRGRVLVDGRPLSPGILVANDYATALDITGTVVARPRHGLTAYRLPAVPRVRSLAAGIFFDRWAEAVVRFRAWPQSSATRGWFRVVLSLPRGLNARNVTLSAGPAVRRILLRPGKTEVVRVPAAGRPLPALEIRADRAVYLGAGTSDARLVALRIPSLEYVPEGRN